MGWKRFIVPTLLGTYLNMMAFGFKYGLGNHADQLTLVNWLRNPSLYPDDIVPRAIALYPTFFWRLVAYGSTWIETLPLVLASFILTKILFFSALTRLTGHFLGDYRLVTCIVGAVALSPLLNDETPFAYSDVLNSVQTQTSLAVALLLWVGCFLVEKRWIAAGIVLGFSVYSNVIFTIYTIFAFAVFALLDWRQQKREIIFASVSIALIAVPWVVLSQGVMSRQFPENYVETMLMRFPHHLTLRSHTAYDLARGAAILVAAASMVALTARLGVSRRYRLELLTGSFVIPLLLGVIAGEILLSPSLLRPLFLRADSFLLLYSTILIQVYGGEILRAAPGKFPAAIFTIGTAAILFPLFLPPSPFTSLPLWVGLTLICVMLISTGRVVQLAAAFAIGAGLGAARLLPLTWIPGKLAVGIMLVSSVLLASRLRLVQLPGKLATSALVVKGLSVYRRSVASMGHNQVSLASGICGLVLIFAAVCTIPSPSRLWNPMIAPDPSRAAWREIQQWAKSNTPVDAKFFISPLPEGFRVFSERSSWVDWKDGNAIYSVPEYASEWRRRMTTLGIDLAINQVDPRTMIRQYKEQPWEHLLRIAKENRLSYIIQYAEVQYPVKPVFLNQRFAVYNALGQ